MAGGWGSRAVAVSGLSVCFKGIPSATVINPAGAWALGGATQQPVNNALMSYSTTGEDNEISTALQVSLL